VGGDGGGLLLFFLMFFFGSFELEERAGTVLAEALVFFSLNSFKRWCLGAYTG